MWQDLAAIATVGQFAVVLAAAIFALLQVQHIRRQNISATIRLMMRELGTERMQRALQFVYHDLAERPQDPAYAEEILSGTATSITHPEMAVVAYYNEVGLLVDYGLTESDPIIPSIANPCLRAWRYLLPVVALVRSKSPHAWSPFQSLVVRCQAMDSQAFAKRYRERTPWRLRAGWQRTDEQIEGARNALANGGSRPSGM